MAKQDDYTKTALRLPRALHQRLMDAAAERGHSLNTEMIYRLDASFGERAPADDADRQFEINAVQKGFRDAIAEIARSANEREDGVRAMGQDLHALCARALPFIDDDERYRSLVRMLADVGVSMQAGDLTDAQARMRALFYLASDARDKSEN